MTTIAARKTEAGWEMAADSQETIEGTSAGDIKLPCQKIFRYDGGIIATAGDSGAGMKFVEHMRGRGGFERDNSREFECLVLSRDGKLALWDQDMIPQDITMPFYAIGTGRMAAFAAMEHGATAKQAVATAAKYDPYTGGTITVERA